MEAARHPWPALGVLLMRDGLVTADELEDVLSRQGDEREERISSQRLGEALVERGVVTSAQVGRLVAEQHELPFVDLEEPDSLVPVSPRLPDDVARLHQALPVRQFPDGSVLVVVADPTRHGCFDDLRRELGVPVRFAVAAPDAIAEAIEKVAEHAELEAAVLAEEDEGEAVELGPSESPDEPADTVAWMPALAPGVVDGRPWPVLGSLLLRDELVTEEELEAALAQQRLSSTRRLGEILVARGSLTAEQVSRALAEQHELPFLELGAHEVDAEAAARLPIDVARAHVALPVSRLPDGRLLVAVGDPASARHADELRAAVGEPLQFAVAMPAEIEAAIESLNGSTTSAFLPDDGFLVLEDVVEPEPEGLDFDDDIAPADPVIDAITAAVGRGATAVHFASNGHETVVRARIDGALAELRTLTGPEAEAADPALAALAAQGRTTVDTDGGPVELRAVSLPTRGGRRTALRVVPPADPAVALDDLVPLDVAHTVRETLEQPSGLLAVCGSDDFTRAALLHAIVQELASPERAIISIEDPVERLVPGVDQVEVDAAAGLTSAAALQTALRADPDVVVVGDLGDAETARLALRGARDRLVVTELDAPTSSAAIRRLLDLGVAPWSLARSPGCVVAHAVLRRLCETCREPYYASEEELAELGRPLGEQGRRLLGRAQGCDACGGTGYRDPVHLFEALPLSNGLRDGAAAVAGVRTVREHAIDLCLDGATTPEELRRLGLAGTS
jgi:type IV pilus assembly protein PilB